MTVLDTNPDPKPPRRIVDKNAGKRKVYELEGRCRLTGSPLYLTRFHLVGRDLGGDDVDDNIIPLNQLAHDEWEHGPNGKTRLGPHIWDVLRPAEKDYVLQKKGPEFVRRYYGVEL